MMTKRIGGTKYKVRITFNENGQETMEDKVLRMIRNDLDDTAQKSYDFSNPGFQNGAACGTMNMQQMSRPA